MATPALSVVIPIRNRAGLRLDNCLRSLDWQDGVDRDTIEIVISDFGSDPEHRGAIAELADQWGARVAYSSTDATWNRARALNIGIRGARGRYVLCTDADMIFAPNFLSTLLRQQEIVADRALVVCRACDLPESVPEKAWTRQDYPWLEEQSSLRERLGTGACQMALRTFFLDVRGYDEGYVFWGCEDGDMLFRAQRASLALRWIHDITSMLHQWHPTTRHERPFRKFLNDARFHMTKYVIVENRFRPWGQP